jgi:hypothetical protein
MKCWNSVMFDRNMYMHENFLGKTATHLFENCLFIFRIFF